MEVEEGVGGTNGDGDKTGRLLESSNCFHSVDDMSI